MNSQKLKTSLKFVGCALVAGTIALSSVTASAQGRNGRDGRGDRNSQPQVDNVVTPGIQFRGPIFQNRRHQRPFADMPRGNDRRIIRWLAEKPLRWHVRMSREFPRPYANRVAPHLRDMPRRWQVRMHGQYHSWYQYNVARSHRLIGGNRGRGRGRGHGRDHSHSNVRDSGHDTHIINSTPPPQGRPNTNWPRRGQAPSLVTANHSTPGGQNCTLNAGTALGAALGGLIGSQIGGGNGRLAATAAGTFIGATLGSREGCR